MSFPRYPKYKSNGVSWFGDAPEHWPTIRYKNVFKEKQSVSGDALPSGSISFGRVVFKSDKILHELTKASYQEVLAGEFLINPINLNYDLKSLRTGLSDINTCVSPAYIVLRAKAESDKNYLKYQLHLFDVSHMKTLGAGVRQTITFGDIGTRSTYLPPLAEQTAIAEFLDRETGKIDELVAEQRRLMELLKEKRQAAISHAVTKGLNPHAPMKPSCIEWLGDVPQGWEVFALNRLVQPGRRITYGIVQPGERDENGRFMVRGQDYSFGWAKPETIFKVSDAVEIPYRRARLMEGDLVITIVGAGVGNVEVVPSWLDGANITQTTARISVDTTKADPRFVSAVLKGPIGRRSVELYAKGAAQPGLNLEHVRIFPITVPPLSEQREIADYIDTEAKQFDALTAEAQRAIDLLQERRTALISAAVTGQIDVRQHPKN
jgi:type I restriction enzyme S subunit